MVTKKNIYHYIFYVVYALIFITGIGFYALNLANAQASESVLMSVFIKYIIVFVGVLLITLGYRLLIKYIPDKFLQKKLPKVSVMVEAGGAVFICIFALFFRLFSLTSVFGNEVNSMYLDYALGKSNALPNKTYLASVYGSICKILVKIHPSEYPIYAFNGILTLGIILLIYYSLKTALRIREALVAVLLIAFLPCNALLTAEINPDIFLTFLISLFIYFLVKLNSLNKNRKIKENYHAVFFVLLGVLAGIISSFDIIGIGLLFIAIPSFFLIKNKEAWLPFQKAWLQGLLFVGGFLVTMFVILNFMPNQGMNDLETVTYYINCFIPIGLTTNLPVAQNLRPEGVVLYIFAGISILGFIRNDDDKGLYFVVISDLAAILTYVEFVSNEYVFLTNVCFIIISTIGFFAVPTFKETEEEIKNEKLREKDKESKRRTREETRDRNNGNLNVSLAPEPPRSIKLEDGKKDVSKERPKVEIIRKEEPVVEVIRREPSAPQIVNKPELSNTIEVKIEKKEENKEVVLNKQESVEIKNEPAVVPQPTVSVSEIKETKSVLDNASLNNDKVLVNEVEESDAIRSIEEDKEPVIINPVPKSETKQVFATVLPEPIDPSKILPSRKEYKTAHVYKSEEERTQHDKKIESNTYTVNNQNAELKGKAGFIKNVLPEPKPHVTRELSYDYTPSSLDDDYDIKDMTGRDYYDL